MKNFCESLREHGDNFKKKKMKLLKTKSRNHMKIQKFVILVKKNFNIKMLKIKIIVKFGTMVIIQGNIEVLHMVF